MKLLAAIPKSSRRWIVLAAVFAAAALLVYRRALTGGLVSDDIVYLTPPYVHSPSAAELVSILDPGGVPARNTGNYAPVHLLAHVMAFRVFGDVLAAHHLLNVLLHVFCALALTALWVRAGIAFAGATVLGAVFLLHTANVEAVAWISQLKSLLALALGCSALLLEPRRPALAALAFAAALLAKFQTAFLVPVAALGLALETPLGRADRRRRALWLAVWAVTVAAVAGPQLGAFEGIRPTNVTTPDGGVARVLFVLALIGRYTAMAATSWGVSAFHQPDLPAGLADGWVLLGAAAFVAASTRFVVVLSRRDREAVFWLWAGAALVPVAQAVPFVYPMADRYLYFVLPGLLGALGMALRAPLGRALADPRRRLVLATSALVLLAVFAVRSDQRAVLWRSDEALNRDSATSYPEGLPAQRLRALDAAERGDVEGLVAAMHAACARGFDNFVYLEREPRFTAYRADPRFRAVVAEVAGAWIANVAGALQRTPPELLWLAMAHRARGEWDQALALFTELSDEPGQVGALARVELAETRARRARAEHEGG